MKVLYVARLFSGLELSVASKIWQPTGVPTIYRLIEALAQQPDQVSVILCAKDGHTVLPDLEDSCVKLEGLNCPVKLLAAKPTATGPITRAFREMRHTFAIIRAVRRSKPTLIYIDHGNVWAAGVLARFLRVPVLFRVMGVYPAMRNALVSGKFANKVLRWCYKSPFAGVICTQDGSGVELWLRRALHPRTPVHILLNGVDEAKENNDFHPEITKISRNAIVVTFVGKLEEAKGIEEFSAAFLTAVRKNQNLHGLIIGSGSLEGKIKDQFDEAGLSSYVTFLKRLPHSQVHSALSRSDIYISLNRYGNLSNANLEAMRVGVAMIMPEAQEEIGVDLATDELIPSEYVVRVKSSNDLLGIEKSILDLASDKERRQLMAAGIKKIAGAKLDSWKKRINCEIEILEKISNSDR
ncbi:glycosyltransferase family 4 protein [Thalassospira xiamenensis]|uniref:glycosyltransferase family 4 protein n=1 Tax=Thalassospira xiamenensis TaxID=220697 RepID=UPI000DEE17FC|nr:glycosyltransferase family 4 protein [Thalassospira xiamenensis]RCK33586.1 hypothetical protein TH24_21300 [Thalassospira xiamenensis]